MSVPLQLARLNRHYTGALPKYDAVSLLDLATTLRVLAEGREDIQQWVEQNAIKLRLPVPTPMPKPVKFALRNVPYLYVPLVSGVPSIPIGIKGLLLIPNSVNRSTEAERRRVAEWMQHRPVAYCSNFAQWMDHWVAQMGFTNPDGTRVLDQISRTMMIKRVANLLGGTHPEKDASQDSNKYDPWIRMMNESKVANGAPLPYYQLLEIAKDMCEQLVLIRR